MAMLAPRCEAVRRAANTVDNLHMLRRLLGVPMSQLHDWLAGRGHPPLDAFLKAVDIVDAQSADDGPPVSRPQPNAKGSM
jgi:hypothetical protein